MCLGLPDQLIVSINYNGGVFVCTEWHTNNNTSSDLSDSAFKQLFQAVKRLCETVQSLSVQVASLASNSSSINASQLSVQAAFLPSSTSTNIDWNQLRTIIREEIQEMEVRGMQAQTVDTFRPEFDNICILLLFSNLLRTNIVWINKERQIFRINIPDDDSRKELLDISKNLKNRNYSNRDLTYKQRGELRARRPLNFNRANGHPPDGQFTARDIW